MVITNSGSSMQRSSSRGRAIKTITQWLESVSGSESESWKEMCSLSDSVPNRTAHIRPGNHPSLWSSKNSATLKEVVRDTKLSQEHIPPLKRLDSDGGDYNDGYSCPQSTTPEDTVFSTMSARQPLVENPRYRSFNLKQNNIMLLPSYDPLPEYISIFVSQVWEYRNPKRLSLNQIQLDKRLAELRTESTESGVASYFQQNLFLLPGPTDGLKCSIKLPMSRHSIPGIDSSLKVSVPVPGILYGYNLLGAFTDGEQVQISYLADPVYGNSDNLMFPFLAIEQKGDGPVSRGSLWVATNQCLGASASCVNIIDQFNQVLKNCNNNSNNNNYIKLTPSIAFSIAMNGSEARLYITWKHGEVQYLTALIDSFLLQRPSDFLSFRRFVLNIMDWGMDARFAAIRSSLGYLLEDRRKTVSRQAKTRRSTSLEEMEGGKRSRKWYGANDNRRGAVTDTDSSPDPLAR